jgi:hypothetical protein
LAPRSAALHDRDRDTFAKLGGSSRAPPSPLLESAQFSGRIRASASRAACRCTLFALLLLPVIDRRLDEDPELRRRFVRLLR